VSSSSVHARPPGHRGHGAKIHHIHLVTQSVCMQAVVLMSRFRHCVIGSHVRHVAASGQDGFKELAGFMHKGLLAHWHTCIAASGWVDWAS
jgi:hypothetical protein